jgi:hypothetical protein
MNVFGTSLLHTSSRTVVGPAQLPVQCIGLPRVVLLKLSRLIEAVK